MTRQSATAITVSYHTGPALHQCLDALISEPGIDRVIVVDNGNPAEVQDWLRSFANETANVELIEPGGNLGFGAAINLAAGRVKSGHLLFVNPDAILAPGALDTLIAATGNAQTPWLAGGQIHDEAGTECRGGRRRKLTLSRALTTFAGWNTWTLEGTPPPDGPVAVGAVSGAFMLTDTASFRKLGGFDEAYFLHVEDVDLCRRAWDAGGEVIYVHQAHALHYGATSDVSGKVVARHKADSLAYYFETFSNGPVARHFIKWGVGPLLRLVLTLRARG